MKKFIAGFVFTSVAALTVAAFADEIPVSRVVLSTSGLANFEMHAKVDGNAALQFPVRLEQVDDILKSLVIFDEKGTLGGVTLPSKQPLKQVFKDLPFNQQQLSSPMLLLNSYQGAELSVEGKGDKFMGKILHVEPEQVALDDNKMVTKHRLSLMTDEGIKQALMEDLVRIEFKDAKVRAEIARALDAIRENATTERRMLTVNLMGDSKRDVALSYVVDAPLWKTAYRLVVPEAGQKEGLLQGWAVVENMTAGDWNNVDLTLVSGNPVTYRQSLYESYYVERPEIPVQVFGRVMPRVDNGAVATAQEMEKNKENAVGGGSFGMLQRRDVAKKMMGKTMNAPAAAPMAMADASNMAMGSGASSEPMASTEMSAVANVANAAQSAEATTQVLFRFPNRFNLKSGQSMMLPFVSRKVPMERVSVYQPDTHPTHPLAAIELKNDGETGLPPGILTLYEDSSALKGSSFVGDAQMPVLGQGEKRVVSYALDSKTTINREDKSTSTEGKMTAAQGVLQVSVVNHMETVYTVKAPPKEDRVVVIEHPKAGGDYKLVTPDPKDVEVTESHYRVRVALKAGETKVVPVALESNVWQSYGLDSMPTDQLMAFAANRGTLSSEVRKQFEKLATVRREMDALDQKISSLDEERQTIFEDQERVRENLKSLHEKSAVQEKYLEKLNIQEDKVAALDKQKQEISTERQKKYAELAALIAELKF